MNTTNQLEQLKNWIQESKMKVKSPEALILKNIDSNNIALAVIPSLLHLYSSTTALTATAGAMGTKILSGLQNSELPENVMRKQRVQCGLVIVRSLLENNVLEMFREKTNEKNRGREKYLLGIPEGSTFIDDLWASWNVEEFNHFSFPCIGKPIDRTRFNCDDGGVLVTNTPSKYFKEYAVDNIPIVYRNINDLQSTPFEINRKVLEVAQNEKLADDSIVNFDNVIIEQEEQTYDKDGKPRDTKQAIVMRSLKRDRSTTIDLANKFQFETFYYYWRLCFRGRYYISASYLSPQGAPLAKSLIKLGTKKKLGIEGYYWLLVHLANTAGYDKLPIDKRHNKAEEMLEEWLKWANDPYEKNQKVLNPKTGEKVMRPAWTQMKDAWGFLATILEVKDAIDSGDKYSFKSGLMIGFDATTSGLQILAALSRDEVTGKLCNLTASEVLGDSYKFIANHTWEKLKKSKNPLAEYWLELYDIRRDLAKRPVMVYVYSCKSKSMGLNVYNDFKGELPGLTKEHCEFLGKLLYNSCAKLLKGPTKLMNLFIAMGLFWAADGDDFKLILPYNKFPLIQHYRDDVSDLIVFKINKRRIRLRYVANKSIVLDEQKIAQATAPNITHGWDSQVVSKLITEAEYRIIPIHDCFLCVPTDAGKLYEDTRTVFTDLFKVDQLKKMLIETDCTGLPQAKIKYGKLKVEEVLDNEYCFS